MKNTQLDISKLKAVMKANRWSGRQLSFAIGLSSEAVGNWLSGRSDPSATNLKKACDVLGLDINEVFISEKAEAAA